MPVDDAWQDVVNRDRGIQDQPDNATERRDGSSRELREGKEMLQDVAFCTEPT